MLTRGEYYLIKNMLEDPTTLEGILTFKSDISEYTTFEKLYLDTQSTKTYNWSDPAYQAFEGVIVDIEFANAEATYTIKLK